jgi:hypothetical protein
LIRQSLPIEVIAMEVSCHKGNCQTDYRSSKEDLLMTKKHNGKDILSQIEEDILMDLIG